MIDRVWALWQLAHPGGGVSPVPLDHPLGPFPTLTVAQTLSTTTLGYDYAVATSSVVPAAAAQPATAAGPTS
jgi:tyrosinase